NTRFGVGFGGGHHVVQGNLIGTDATGTYAIGNAWGIICGQSANNLIGGTTAAARNVISGNFGPGIESYGTDASGNVLEGNYFGTNAAGTAAVGNNGDGVLIEGSSNNTIGGTAAGAGNLISGNGYNGINLFDYFGATVNNLVQGNFIGT